MLGFFIIGIIAEATLSVWVCTEYPSVMARFIKEELTELYDEIVHEGIKNIIKTKEYVSED